MCIVMFAIITNVVLLIKLVSSTVFIPYSDPSKCLSKQYFQFSSLQCVNCGLNQKSSENKLFCICDNGFKYVVNNGGPVVTCQSCGNNLVTSTDGWNCLSCPSNSFDSSTKLCRSCPGERSVGVDQSEDGALLSTQQCITCQQNTQPNPSPFRVCKSCNQHTLRLTRTLPTGESCVCPVGTVNSVTIIQANGICFISSETLSNTPSTFTVFYPNSEKIVSGYFKEYLISSHALCKRDQNFTACQQLGNLCVMFMYDEENYANPRLSTTDACKEYLLIIASYTGEFVSRLIDWPISMPWLFYKADSTNEVLDGKAISMTFQRGQSLNFALVKYAANGTFLEIVNDTSEIDMCFVSEAVFAKAFQFTTTYKSNCKIKTNTLLKKHETVFYDMFFKHDNGLLYPVPVLVKNVKSNSGSDRSTWQLTRRFFLVDNVSGRRTDIKQPVEIVQYAESIELSYRLIDDGKIYPPLLTIKYAAINVNSQAAKEDRSVSFEVNYLMDTSSIKRNIEISVGVLSILGLIYATIRLISWRRRQGTLMLDCSSFLVYITFICSALAFVFLIILIATCLQWLIFFKQQTTVIRLLPTGSQQDLLKGLFIAAFFMKCLDLLYILYSQIFVDIFFIDWERPRGVVSVNADGNTQKSVSIPPSIIRTLFVANEWNELQTVRRIKPVLQVMLVLFFLEVVGLNYWTTTDPWNRFSVDKTTDYIGERNFCLRFAVISLLYILIAIVQWIIFGVLFERFVSDAVGDFVDFCSMSNISVFLMTHAQFGYYIHGRSVHGRSDTSLHELYEQFQREEDNLCGKRGLEANSEIQTFEIALTTKFRNEYTKIVQPLLTRDTQQGRRGQPGGRQNPGLPGTALHPALERSVNAYSQMNYYLSAFIEHAIRDNDYGVREKFMLEKLLQNELQPPLDKSVFYMDDGHSFTRMLLYGQEWSLLIFELLFFIMIDWLSSWNSVLAAICTYLIDLLFVTIRESFGKKNLANKTMVSERFLI